MSLEQQAAERKARLLALRDRRDGKRKAPEEEPISIVHRAFDESTNAARPHNPAETSETVEKAVQGLSQDIVAQDAEKRQEELDLLSIQPKKPNWDLKRDVEKKLSQLDYTYKSAVAHLIRQRIKADAASGRETDDLAAAVSARQAADENSDDD